MAIQARFGDNGYGAEPQGNIARHEMEMKMKTNTKSQPRTEREFAAAIEDALFASSQLNEFVFQDGTRFGVDRIDSFRDAGMHSAIDGLVVRLEDGSVFHVVVKRA